MIAGPGSAVAGEDVFLVLCFFAQTLAGNPPARNFLHLAGIGHVDDHDRVAIRALVILQPQLIVPAAIEVRVLAAVVEIVVRAVALLAGVVFFQQFGLGGIGDVVIANSAQAFEVDGAVAQFLVVRAVRETRAWRMSAARQRCTS